jgi:hypothetical protein
VKSNLVLSSVPGEVLILALVIVVASISISGACSVALIRGTRQKLALSAVTIRIQAASTFKAYTPQMTALATLITILREGRALALSASLSTSTSRAFVATGLEHFVSAFSTRPSASAGTARVVRTIFHVHGVNFGRARGRRLQNSLYLSIHSSLTDFALDIIGNL